MRILFVCLGNICRSPTAEGVFRDLVKKQNLSIHVESRGTGGWHIGDPPDPRSLACAKRFGIDLSDLRGSQFSTYDFANFDLILVMDERNYQDVSILAKSDEERKKVQFLLDYHSESKLKSVPDPYQGGPEGFQTVFLLIREACKGLLEKLKENLNPGR